MKKLIQFLKNTDILNGDNYVFHKIIVYADEKGTSIHIYFKDLLNVDDEKFNKLLVGVKVKNDVNVKKLRFGFWSDDMHKHPILYNRVIDFFGLSNPTLYDPKEDDTVGVCCFEWIDSDLSFYDYWELCINISLREKYMKCYPMISLEPDSQLYWLVREAKLSKLSDE